MKFSRLQQPPVRVDVRIIAATNRNLDEEVRRGRFRADLYFRISSMVIAAPALLEDGAVLEGKGRGGTLQVQQKPGGP